jgi:outer membrane biosynthesis protein TonB
LETKPILRDHSHSPPDDDGACAHCGQPLVARAPSYGDGRVSRTGLAVTVGLHVLLVLLFVYRSVEEKPPVPASGTDITYIKALPGKPKRIEPPKPTVKPVKPVKQRKPEVVIMQRLPDTITLPEEKPVKVEEPEPPPPEKVAPAEDMSARIAARQAARDTARAQDGEESEAERGNRLARANIAAANGKSRGDDEETGVSAKILSFNAANLDFRGWDPG